MKRDFIPHQHKRKRKRKGESRDRPTIHGSLIDCEVTAGEEGHFASERSEASKWADCHRKRDELMISCLTQSGVQMWEVKRQSF